MLSLVTAYIDKHNLLKPHTTVVVGLSGGPDSVCLLHILYKLKDHYTIKLIAAHLDHEWREESHEDALFCANLAQHLGIPFVSAKASNITLEKKPRGSQEELGRMLRRCFLESVTQEHSASAIALGHHYDDQQETFFIRFIRGASIAGLASMRPQSGIYIRPLLFLTKAQILDYLKEHTLSYRQDYTNLSESYLRNRIRHILLPAFRQCDTRFDTTFASTLNNIQETDNFLERYAQKAFDSSAHMREGRLWLDKEKFFSLDPFLYPRILVLWLCRANVPFTPTNRFFNEIIRFIKRPGSGSHRMHPTWSLVKDKRFISITTL